MFLGGLLWRPVIYFMMPDEMRGNQYTKFTHFYSIGVFTLLRKGFSHLKNTFCTLFDENNYSLTIFIDFLDTYLDMFHGLAEYMTEKGLDWHPNLKMISDWEQVKEIFNIKNTFYV